MKGIVCKICGYISIDGEAPGKCPVCGAPKEAFAEKEAIKIPQDPANLTDLEKKHIPVIKINKTCGLVPEGCVDVHVLMGEIIHPMEANHYIVHVDFYLDKAFLGRVHLTPVKLNPACSLHLKAGEGELTVIEFCNQHGNWMTRKNL